MNAPADFSGALTRLTVDPAAIVANYRRLAREASGASCAAVVKADAYGLGMRVVAPALAWAGCADFFVASPDEGASLRRLLPAARIFVLCGLAGLSPADFEAENLVPVVNTLGEIETLRGFATATGRAAAMALHVDTGMNRLGLTQREAAALADTPEALAALDPVLLMSHFACADRHDHLMTAEQIARFENLRARFPAMPASLAASSGIFRAAAAHFDMVRPGCALYGINPTREAANPMAPVCRLEARVLQVREIAAGETVGYGATFTAPAAMRIATVAAGYADGVLRAAGNLGYAHAAGHRLPIIGRVSMDLISLDITALPPHEAAPGAWVTLLGPERPVDAVAAEAGTIGYEILTRIAPRAARRVGAL
jgi:alanine racemase